jgi:aspartate ammonia-lyase
VKIFTSVLGFNFNVTIVDNEGNPIKTGAKVIVPVNMGAPNVGTKIGGQSWFTNYNEQLLTKIRDYRRRND